MAVDELAQATEKEINEISRSEPHEDDRSLADRMIAEWVLEHAGDENDADEDTSEAQWEAAAERAFGTDDLEHHSEIFAYQTKALFNKIGVHPWGGQLLLEEYWDSDPPYHPRTSQQLPRPHYSQVLSKFKGRKFLWPKAIARSSSSARTARSGGGRRADRGHAEQRRQPARQIIIGALILAAVAFDQWQGRRK